MTSPRPSPARAKTGRVLTPVARLGEPKASRAGSGPKSSLGLGGHLTLSRSYEPQRPLLTNLVTKQDTTTIYRQGYAYDDVGNIVGMQRFSGDSAGYDYDKLYQLRGVRYPKGNTDNRAANLSYGYDANGNRTSFGHDFTNKDRPEWLGYQPATGSTATSNRLQQGWSGREGYTGYGYDFRGNLSSEKSFGDSNSLVSGSNAWKEEARTFNRRNELERLFHTTRQSGADSSVWAYDYDEKGMRVEKRRTALPVTLTGNDTSWSFDRKYAYDGVSAVADSSAGDTAWNYWVMMGLNRVAQVRRDGAKKWQVHYVVTDHLGTANLVTDSVGQVVQRNVLDPWGNLEMSSGTTPVAYLYTGKEWDAESGEYYFAARYYNPERGSFTGRDPKLQFWTPYSYVGDGVITMVDPTGMAAWETTTQWSPEMVDQYHEFALNFVPQVDKKLDCADLAVTTLVEFSAEKKLPLNFGHGLKSGSDKFNTKDQFLNEAKLELNTATLKLVTKGIDWRDAKSGDLLIQSNLKHTMIFFELVNTKNGPTVNLYQGNIPAAIPEFHSIPKRWFDGWLIDEKPRTWNFPLLMKN